MQADSKHCNPKPPSFRQSNEAFRGVASQRQEICSATGMGNCHHWPATYIQTKKMDKVGWFRYYVSMYSTYRHFFPQIDAIIYIAKFSL